MKDKILVHICCGVCAIETFEFLEKEFEPAGFWYNPNIQPYNEYRLRLQAAGFVFQQMGKSVCWKTDYDVFDWFNKILPVANNKNLRCERCYEIRLEKTAQFAISSNIKIFTTTMFFSVHQNLEMIKEKGISIAKKYGIEFLPLDLRHFYQTGIEKAKKLQIYRQRYCGCLFSELEREKVL